MSDDEDNNFMTGFLFGMRWLLILKKFLTAIFSSDNDNDNRPNWYNALEHLQWWLCYLQGTRFESHLWPVEFFSCNKIFLLVNANACAMCPNNLAIKAIKEP